MRWYAKELGYGAEEEFWGIAGLLHDIDFEQYPEQHCVKAPELLKEGGAEEELIHAVCSQRLWPLLRCETHARDGKGAFRGRRADGPIGAAAKMRPSKSVMDMEVSSLKKKFKDKRFAAGCSRDVIRAGAERLGWELDRLFEQTISPCAPAKDRLSRK